MDELPIEAGAGSERATCPSCHSSYDAATVPFCDCLTDSRTPRCPSCGACLCKLPLDQQREFWAGAPPELHRRRLQDRHREMPETACHPSADSRPLALVVEDEPVTRLLAAKLLSQLGFRVACAARGDEGLDTAMALRPALVLTDALLPKLDGRELCKRLKDAPETGKTRIIVMSGLYTKTQNRTDALRTFKADGYLKKPIDLADLRAEVERVLPGGPLSKPAEF